MIPSHLLPTEETSWAFVFQMLVILLHQRRRSNFRGNLGFSTLGKVPSVCSVSALESSVPPPQWFLILWCGADGVNNCGLFLRLKIILFYSSSRHSLTNEPLFPLCGKLETCQEETTHTHTHFLKVKPIYLRLFISCCINISLQIRCEHHMHWLAN